MGIFSSLFRGHSEAPADPEEVKEQEVEEEQTSVRFPRLTKGMSLDVTAENGIPLLTGQISEMENKSVTLERKPGQLAFATCERGSTATVRGYINGTVPFDLSGTVEESSRIRFRIKDLKVVERSESRNNFRLFLNIPMTMYYEEDEKFQNPEQCTLVNISTGGACVESEFIHTEGEVLCLKIQIKEYTPMLFRSEIIRVDEPKPGIFRYGMLFAKLDDRETASLTRLLFNVQVGNTSEWRQSSGGSWG